MTTAAKTTSKAAKTASKALATLKDPTGKKRANARHRLMWTAGAAVGGAMLAGVVGFIERRRRQGRSDDAFSAPQPRTAGVTQPGGGYRSRHGVGAPASSATASRAMPSTTASRAMPMSGGTPLDKLAASAEHLRTWGGDEPGFRAHLGFGVGGSIPGDPVERVGDSMPTGGGDALGGTVRGGKPGDFAHEIVTGAGEAIGNSTTRTQNGNGTLH